MFDLITNVDASILLFIQEHLRCEALTPFFQCITKLGNAGVLWILITLGLLVYKKTRKLGMMCALALILTLIINNLMVKNIVCRTRPFDRFSTIIALIPHPKDFSFFSGHTSSSFACALTIFRHSKKKYGIPLMIIAVLIAASRLYLGVHYPTDVLVGAICGIIFSYAAEKIVDRYYKEKYE